jgi:hypothetical protein
MVAVKVALSIMGLLLLALVFTATFAVVTCAVHGAKAIGWPALRNDPVYWLLLILVFGGTGWVCWRWMFMR